MTATRLDCVEVSEDEKARIFPLRLDSPRDGCRAMRIRDIRTRPFRPRTNGKADRFIRTMLGGWAYGAIYRDSTQRTAALSGWLDFYNWRRPHGSLGHKPPGARLAELNNVAGSYI
jgi:transposase InsO family protein